MQQENYPGGYITVPKALFRNPEYGGLPALSKLLYGFLLDRSSLSRQNGWEDQDGRTFLYFPIEEIAERFGCGHDKASGLLRALDQSGLIRRTRSGRGTQIVVEPLHPGISEPGKPESAPLPTRKTSAPHLGKSVINKPEEKKPEENNPYPTRALAAAAMKENISYDVLLEEMDKHQLDNILEVMVDAVFSGPMKIAGIPRTHAEICRMFYSLDDMDIRYVRDRLKQESQCIKSPRGYLLARLYEAKSCADLFYRSWVQSDFRK